LEPSKVNVEQRDAPTTTKPKLPAETEKERSEKKEIEKTRGQAPVRP
jgi:hypothetical protein